MTETVVYNYLNLTLLAATAKGIGLTVFAILVGYGLYLSFQKVAKFKIVEKIKNVGKSVVEAIDGIKASITFYKQTQKELQVIRFQQKLEKSVKEFEVSALSLKSVLSEIQTNANANKISDVNAIGAYYRDLPLTALVNTCAALKKAQKATISLDETSEALDKVQASLVKDLAPIFPAKNNGGNGPTKN